MNRFPHVGTAPRQAGVVLPIVLIVMMVVTMLIVTQVRRGTVDERLASNWNRAISQQAAAESLLRYCEARILRSEEVRLWRDAVRSENFTTLTGPAWRNVGPPDVLPLAADILPLGATGGFCVVENATEELGGNTFQESTNAGSDGIRDPYLWKYRFTLVVVFADASAFGSVTHRTQSEVRFVVI
jgi:hypothetical protein